MPALGRRPAPDVRDHEFAMLTAVEALTITLPDRRYWGAAWWDNQGDIPRCVGSAWAHWLELGPIGHVSPAPVVKPQLIYRQAQLIDEWPGEDYEGTSVRAGAKVLQSKGFISAYLWAFDAQTVMDAVLGVGPVVVGTNWTEGMMKPDANGFIHYRGAHLGGHAYAIDGANRLRRKFRMRQSWGRQWGENGRAWISFDDMERLIDDAGEACLAVEINVG